MVLTTVLQKGQNPGPSDIRPIGITPILYRVWSAIRFQHLQPWAESIYPRQLTAYRHGIDVQLVNLQRAINLEESLLNGESVINMSFDLRKAFDHVPHEALTRLLERLSLPERILGLLRHRCAQQKQHWKIFGCLSPPRVMKRGIVQGCALSCLFFNMMMVPLIYATLEEPECDPLEIHADDVYLVSEEEQRTTQTYGLMSEYLDALRIPIQPSKTQCLATGRFATRTFDLGGVQVGSVSQIKVLGQHLCSVLPKGGNAMYLERETRYLRRLKNIDALKLPMPIRIRMIQTMAGAVLNFSPWQAPPSAANKLRAPTVSTLYPRLPRHRCSEVLLHVLFAGHTLDPPGALLYRLLNAVAQQNAKSEPGEEHQPYLPSNLGPRSTLVMELENLGFRVEPGARVRYPGKGMLDLRMPTDVRERKVWQHNWREAIRQAIFTLVVDRRPEFQGIQGGIDRSATRLLSELLTHPRQRLHHAMTVSGAQVTSVLRMKMGFREDDCCPFCDQPGDSVWHRFWECVHWGEERMLWFEAGIPDVPQVLLTHGIVPLGSGIPIGLVLRIQGFQLALSLKMSDYEKTEEGTYPIFQINLEDWQGWVRSARVRKHVHEQVLNLRPEMEVPEAPPQSVGEHQVIRTGPTTTICANCECAFAVSSLSRYAYSSCRHGRASTARLPANPKVVSLIWQLPRPGGISHDVGGDIEPGDNIRCKKCSATWRWNQRFQIRKSPCEGTPHMEAQRKARLDEHMPLMRNGHLPQVHGSLRALMCTYCGFITGSEAIRGFDRCRCSRLGGVLRPPVRRQYRYLSVNDPDRGHLAVCRGCEYSVPWYRRAFLFKRHQCARLGELDQVP